MTKNYRRDIDSLRAVSVLFVILFHFKLPYFEGGYLGVDIFFVISGFLITKIILKDIQNNSFKIKSFYLRRVRRIIPLVLFVTFTSTIFAYYFFFPSELKEYLKSLLSVNLFVSNFWYDSKGGYFGAALDNNPLIHFWSLSVEEQFYLFYPIIIFFFYKKKMINNFSTLIIITTLFSFSLSQFGGNLKFRYPFFESQFDFFSMPKFAFYSTVTRAWEILIGCTAAIYQSDLNKKFTQKKMIINLSFLLLIFSFFLFNEATPHPSLFTLFPILFTVLILVFNENNISNNKILNSKFLSYIGLISFSLYLWHQPILSFAKLYNIIELDFYSKFFIFLLLFPVSFISWKYIEKPFRNKKKINNNQLAGSLFIFISFFLVIIYFTNDKIKSFDNDLVKILEQGNNYEKKYFDNCTTIPKNYIKVENACVIGKKNKNIKHAIIGDSHAAALADAFDHKFRENGISAYLFTINGCPLTLNLYNYFDKRFKCKKYYKELIEFLDKNKQINKIILHSRWGFYTSGKRFNNFEGGIEIGKDSLFIRQEKDFVLNKSDKTNIVLNEIKDFIEKISNDREIFIISSVPEVGLDVPNVVARSLKFNKSEKTKNFTTSLDVYLNRQFYINKIFDQLSKRKNIKVFNSNEVFCQKRLKRCNFTIDNKPLYFDDDHLNQIGSKILIDKFITKVNYLKK